MKASRFVIICVLIFSVTLILPGALAHSPLGAGDGKTIESATVIPDPAKSWAIYSALDNTSSAQYYIFDMDAGGRILISLIMSQSAKTSGFMPSFVLMGPGIPENDSLPSYIEKPNESGYGFLRVNGTLPTSGTYEAFSPSAFYDVTDLDINATETGDYFIVVFTQSTVNGQVPVLNYGLAVGYLEEFTVTEWLFLPFTLISIYEWTGQSIVYVLLPIVAVMAVGLAFMYWRSRQGKTPKTLTQWMIGIASLLILSWGANVVFQMLNALTYATADSFVIVTVMFALMSILIGLVFFFIAKKDQAKLRMRDRILLISLSGLAIFVLAGFLIGPIMAIVSAAMPERKNTEEKKE